MGIFFQSYSHTHTRSAWNVFARCVFSGNIIFITILNVHILQKFDCEYKTKIRVRRTLDEMDSLVSYMFYASLHSNGINVSVWFICIFSLNRFRYICMCVGCVQLHLLGGAYCRCQQVVYIRVCTYAVYSLPVWDAIT